MQKQRHEKVGVVTSNKMQKTVVVTVEWQTIHPFYKRVVRHSRSFLAHDEKNECRPGDRVRIQETRPLSRQKRWRVVEVMHKAVQVAPLPEATV